VELSDIQKEICARISANDLVKLLKGDPSRAVVLDLRPYSEIMKITDTLGVTS
jgi:hypothetical protein